MRQRMGGEVGNVPWLTKGSGLAALQLSTTASGVEGLHDVEVSKTPFIDQLLNQCCMYMKALEEMRQTFGAMYVPPIMLSNSCSSHLKEMQTQGPIIRVAAPAGGNLVCLLHRPGNRA